MTVLDHLANLDLEIMSTLTIVAIATHSGLALTFKMHLKGEQSSTGNSKGKNLDTEWTRFY